MGGYYVYLPAIFIYQDLGHLSFKEEISRKYDIPEPFNGIHDIGQRKLDKYAIGTSLFELPTFLAAHAYCLLFPSEFPADGYSLPYEYGLIFATALWSFVGIWVLRKFLSKNFKDSITAIVLTCIAFGTNFYTYTVFDPGMSHNFSFFLFACLIYLTDKWYRTQERKTLCSIGVVLGLMTIVRPVNLIAILIPLLWSVYNKETLTERWKTLIIRYKDLLLSFVCFLAIVFIQLSYWKLITGQWIFYSYKDEEFWFSNPKIIKGLFSFRKGWFVYTPIAFIGLTGLLCTPRKYILSVITFFTIMIYIAFSWENWYYGYGFGARALIETLPVVALPLAFLTTWVLNKMPVSAKATYLLILACAIALNMFQSYQYSYGFLHGTRMSRDYYWAIFGQVHNKPEYEKYLMPDKEYWDEIKEWCNN